MTNLERAAAIAAERGWPLVETYRGWAVYKAETREKRDRWAVHPHELGQREFRMISADAFQMELDQFDSAIANLGLFTWSNSVADHIDRLEAAREAMPATAFFGVEEGVGI